VKNVHTICRMNLLVPLLFNDINYWRIPRIGVAPLTFDPTPSLFRCSPKTHAKFNHAKLPSENLGRNFELYHVVIKNGRNNILYQKGWTSELFLIRSISKGRCVEQLFLHLIYLSTIL